MNTLLLLAQAAVYFLVMMTLLKARRVFGIGVFMCALGVMHFLETYLASVFYIQTPFGIISPGSTVLFSGKLLMILLLYIREDVLVARQPIYGLLFGNFLVVALVMILRNHDAVDVIGGRVPDIGFIDEIGLLMVWGSILLFIDSIAVILLYEQLGKWLGRNLAIRFLICGATVLTFDQAGFFLALHYIYDVPSEAFFGGWAAKMAATLVYTSFFMIYLKYFDAEDKWLTNRSFKDVFDMLTYRERYEDLLKIVDRDHLTGAYHRRHYDTHAPEALQSGLEKNNQVSFLVIDIDYFKSINDRLGHKAGDEVLKTIAQLLQENLRTEDQLYRYGGEEFVLICDRMAAGAALALAERIRKIIERFTIIYLPEKVTVSIGVATAPHDGATIEELFETADGRLYEAKKTGRNKVIGSGL